MIFFRPDGLTPSPGLATSFPASFRILEILGKFRSLWDGRLQDHILSRMKDTLQSALLLGNIRADGDGGSEEGLSDEGVEAQHNFLWQLLQEVHPLLL